MFSGVAIRDVVTVHFYRWEPTGLRSVSYQKQCSDSNDDGDCGIRIELSAPIMEEGYTDECDLRCKSTTDIVCNIPEADGASAFLLAKPVHEGLSAGWPAHPLDPAIDCLEDDEWEQACVKVLIYSADDLNDGGEDESEEEEPAWVGAIGDGAHEELGCPVGEGQPGHREPEVGLCVLRVGIHDVRDG